jgi:hypothetical protein
MSSFEQIWESSRTNTLSWLYPTALWYGAAVIVALYLMKDVWLRRIGKLVAIAVFSVAATEFSVQNIQEKWRIRREWAESHPERMTGDGLEALSVDGANLLLGPLLQGCQAFLLFVGVAIVLSILRSLFSGCHNSAMDSNEDHIDRVREPGCFQKPRGVRSS